MYFLNLTAFEFFSLLSTVTAVVTLLYLFDRRRKQKKVSTLKFWRQLPQRVHHRNRRRLEQPWSMILQLAGLALLLLALAQLEWGERQAPLRNHVLLLDTSSAAGATLDQEKELAVEYISALNNSDRVMLVEAAGLITPRTAFTANRTLLRSAIQNAKPAATALNITRALDFAARIQARPDGERGEITYIGPQRVTDAEWPEITNLRLIPVSAAPAHTLLTSLSATPDSAPSTWNTSITVRNFADRASAESVAVTFGASSLTPRTLFLKAGQTGHLEYRFAASGGGILKARLQSGSEASLALPANNAVRVAIFSSRPEIFRPLLEADPRLQVQYLPPSGYAPNAAADLVILDQFAPGILPRRPALIVDPPRENSPLPVRSTVTDERVTGWTSDLQLGRGLHSGDLYLKNAHVYDTFSGDVVVASVKEGPVVVSRQADGSAARDVIAGFDLAGEGSGYELSTALLLRNILNWLAPPEFAPADIVCRAAGLVDIPLSPEEVANPVQIVDASGRAVPSTIRAGTLEFYADQPGIAHILSSERDRAVSLTLPEAAPYLWKPKHVSATGIPRVWKRSIAPSTNLWRGLAVAGALVLAIEWIFFAGLATSWRKGLKLASAVAIIAALFVPAFHLPQKKTALIALVDTSLSISPAAISQAAAELNEIVAHRGRNWMIVLPFSLHAEATPGGGVQLVPASLKPKAAGTDLEAALTEGIGSVPDGYVPRILLFSDGNENQGSAIRGIAELRRRGIAVDTVPLTSATRTELAITAAAMPHDAFRGEQIPVDLTLVSPRDTQAIVHLRADDKAIGDENIRFTAGVNRLRLHARINAAGAVAVTGEILTGTAGSTSFNQVVHLRTARILYVSEDPPGTSANLLAALKSAGLSIATDASLLDRPLDDVSLVILNNLDLSAIPIQRKLRIAEFVSSGGGLLIIGGERQIYKEDRQMDALDAVLPAKLAPPHTPEGIVVALVIDKSSSMEGRKIQLARLSAIGVVDHLTSRDMIGVLIFDNSYQWTVPIRPAIQKSVIKRLIAGITPDGGTQIAPALAEAYRKVLRKESAYKHIVLLTDGISEEGDSFDLAREAQSHNVTISTVGLGQDVNRSYLEKVASLSGGQSYFLNNPQGLEQLLLKDVQDYSGTSTIEKPLLAAVKQNATILDGVDFEHAPPLKGYARYEARPDAETLLTINADKPDPLLVRWQYGLGRAAIFASDAKNRWAQDWMKWPGFDRLWINIAHDLIAQHGSTEATAYFDPANETLTVRYRLPDASQEPAQAPKVFVLGPGNFAAPAVLVRMAPRIYQAQLRVPESAGVGMYRVRPAAESRLFPEAGVYRSVPEFTRLGVNEPLLRQIAFATGGRYNPSPDSIFHADVQTTWIEMELWPVFIGFAIVLTLTELVLRKSPGFYRL